MAASEDFRHLWALCDRAARAWGHVRDYSQIGDISPNMGEYTQVWALFPKHGRNVSRIVRMLFHTGTVCFPVLTVWVRAVRVQSLAQFCHSRATSRLGQKDERKKDSYHGTVVSYGGIIDCFIGYTSVTSTS